VPIAVAAPPRALVRRATTVLVVSVALASASCAKLEDPVAAPSRDRTVSFVATRVVPAGKTLRAAKADGSIELEEVPGDVVGGDGLDDIGPIECLIAGRALPVGTVLRRSQFVDPSEMGLERGLSDGTTVDPEC